MKSLLLSHSDGGGGAGRAAYRLQQALVAAGVDSRMHVDYKTTDDPRVSRNSCPLAELGLRARILAEQVPGKTARVDDPGLFSPGLASAISARSIDASSADVINVHWANMGFLSIRQLGRITKPMVWTLHDMWAFAGGRNYAPDSPDARWRSPYEAANRPADGSRWDVDRWVWNRKRRDWTRPQQIVTPSRWLAELVEQSNLMGTWPVAVIPNPLDTNAFRPYPQAEARAFHHLPPDVPLVLFALTTDLNDPRKGWDLLREALQLVHLERPDVELAVLGHDAPPEPWATDLPRTHWLGRLSQDEQLAMAYGAADVTVVPSRQDNLPQTGTEAQACGCPVVAFRIGGLPDVVDDAETGLLADPFDTAALAHAINTLISSDERRGRMAQAARARAERLWSERVVATQYRELFSAVSDH
jgi:glycosyltransferase involved in cell wall biosynthesis